MPVSTPCLDTLMADEETRNYDDAQKPVYPELAINIFGCCMQVLAYTTADFGF